MRERACEREHVGVRKMKRESRRRHCLEFVKKYILRKTEANFPEIGRKHVFTSSNRNMIKNRV